MSELNFTNLENTNWDSELVGEPPFEDGSSIPISEKVRMIIDHQFRNKISNSGIRGFLFHGQPGIGKTVTAKKIAHDLHAFILIVDGATIARHLYGDSEQRIKEIFSKARSLPNEGKCIILFDDVESLFMSRGATELVREWHFSQNSVFFHEVDEMDTSRCSILLTTNRIDLVDEAIKDRFYNIKFPNPSIETLLLILKKKALDHALNGQTVRRLQEYVETHQNEFNSIRDVLRYFEKEYVDYILLSKRKLDQKI